MYDNAAKVPPMNMNCRLHTSASYWGGVTINVVDFKIHEVDFVSQANSCPSSQFSCACCGILSPDKFFCPKCKGPICSQCDNFAKTYDCGKENKCKWCGEKLFQSCQKISLENMVTLSSCLADAISGYPYFRIWIRNNRQNTKFDLTKICWQRYFDAIGWFFFVEAEWFFQVNLPRQYEVVIESILHRRRFRDFDALKRIRNPFYSRFKTEEKEPEFFSDSTNSAFMYSFAMKMLERMKNCYSFTVLKRLRAKHAERLSIRLGVYLPPPPPEQDSDGEL